METFGSRFKLNNAVLCMNLEDTITVSAVVGHTELAPQVVERKDVGNSIRVEIDRCVAKIGASVVVDIVPLLQWT